ncbi:MAG: LacI family DNA-binding transcriptional regulator [Sphaerochaetaceae bacterium]|nr:LacI family DNA-binding transcriptional regulator [Sphaerochaetaceae bacterium]MDC7246999.1 LacI family DNA-binding transcriptional regulator [Sphaerochaetaceae bacterium]
MASLKDVAQLAGVSPSTVSRVMNNTIFVSPDTREKVEQAIREVNYKPNILAQSLRLKATKNIGLLVPEIAHPSFNLVIKYVVDSAAKRGLNTIVCNTHNDDVKEAKIIDSLVRQAINGIIFIRVSDKSHIVNVSRSTNVPMVVLDRAFNNERIPNITADNYQAGVLAAEHLVSKGRRHIATITGKFDISLARDRHQGFVDTLRSHDIELDEELIYEGGFTYQSGMDGVKKFLESDKEFDGLWAQNDLIAAAAISTLLRNGKRVPQDVSVVGMDDVQFAPMIYPSITTIAQPFKEMCDKSVEYLDKLTRNEKIEKHHISFPCFLVERESS